VTACVLDASVAAKWFLPRAQETLTDEALWLLKGYVKGSMSLVVPDLFWPEIGNIFWKAVRRARISRESAESALLSLQEQRITTVPTSPLLKDAFAIAAAFDRTVYDSMYVALSVASNVPLITADERLANALGAQFSVRWLGSLPQ
jgi:predicted nucleic acid-binding protein